MAPTDIGESLVGAYLRHVVGCDVIVHNRFFADRQGEVDVVGLQQGPPRTVWLCEVTTHIGGMLIVRNRKDAAVQVIADKLGRLRHFAHTTFPDEQYRYEWWSPRVAVGRLTSAMKTVEAEWRAAGRDLQFVINKAYTARVRQLGQSATADTSTTNEPAYRMLQILTRLRGSDFSL